MIKGTWRKFLEGYIFKVEDQELGHISKDINDKFYVWSQSIKIEITSNQVEQVLKKLRELEKNED